MIRYWLWDRTLCRWVRVVTSRAVWAATPKAVGVLVCAGAAGPTMAPLPLLPPAETERPAPVVLASPEWPVAIPPDTYWPLPTLEELRGPEPSEAYRRVVERDVPAPAWAALAGLLALVGLKGFKS